MSEIGVKLLKTFAEPAAGPDEPGLILLAGTRGVLRRVRHDVQEIVAAFNDGRAGAYLFGAKSAGGYAEVDVEEYIEWTAWTGWEDRLPRVERQFERLDRAQRAAGVSGRRRYEVIRWPIPTI